MLNPLIVMILLHCIPHDALKNNIMRKLVHGAYKVRGAKYLIVDTHGKAHSSSVTARLNIDKNKLVEWMEYLIDNVYVIRFFDKLLAFPWAQTVHRSWQT